MKSLSVMEHVLYLFSSLVFSMLCVVVAYSAPETYQKPSFTVNSDGSVLLNKEMAALQASKIKELSGMVLEYEKQRDAANSRLLNELEAQRRANALCS